MQAATWMCACTHVRVHAHPAPVPHACPPPDRPSPSKQGPPGGGVGRGGAGVQATDRMAALQPAYLSWPALASSAAKCASKVRSSMLSTCACVGACARVRQCVSVWYIQSNPHWHRPARTPPTGRQAQARPCSRSPFKGASQRRYAKAAAPVEMGGPGRTQRPLPRNWMLQSVNAAPWS